MRKTCLLLLLLVILLSSFKYSQACTIFSINLNGKVLVGNNEDFWYSVDASMWFVPASKQSYGRVLFGWDKFAQGGMNDKGLFFDAAATPISKMPVFPNKPTFKGNIGEEVLAKCSTVEQAIKLIESYNIPYQINGHLMFVDSKGDSAIVEWVNSEVKIIKKEGSYQITTNFLLSKPELGGFPCLRYNKVEQTLKQKKEVSSNDISSILSIVTQYGETDGRKGGTLYSNIYDLNNLEVVIFYKRDFNNPIKVNLEKELQKGKHFVKLQKLFNTK